MIIKSVCRAATRTRPFPYVGVILGVCLYRPLRNYLGY